MYDVWDTRLILFSSDKDPVFEANDQIKYDFIDKDFQEKFTKLIFKIKYLMYWYARPQEVRNLLISPWDIDSIFRNAP